MDAVQEQNRAHTTWHAATFVTIKEVTVNNAVDGSTALKRNQLLLDNQADFSIIHPDLLTHLSKADHELKINGVGGEQLIVQDTGDLQDFFRVYSSEHTKANVLCFADIEDKYKVTYVPQVGFIVHMDDRDLEFKRKGKLYIAEWDIEDDQRRVMAMVKENEDNYSKRQVEMAKLAYEFVKNSGFPSEE
jgi:hypothetical protein